MTIRHPEKINKPINPIKKKPSWIRSKLTNSQEFFLTKTIVNQYKLNTVAKKQIAQILQNVGARDMQPF